MPPAQNPARDLLREIVLAAETIVTVYGRQRIDATKELRALHALLRQAEKIKEATPESDRKQPVGMILECRTVWLRRSNENLLRLGDEERGILHAFYGVNAEKRFKSACEAVINGTFLEKLAEKRWDLYDRREHLARALEIPVDTPLNSERVFVCGVKKGVFWFGYRDGATAAAQLLQCVAKKRVEILRRPPADLRIESFPIPTKSPSAAPLPTDNIKTQFGNVARAILRGWGCLPQFAHNCDKLAPISVTDSASAVVAYAEDFAPQEVDACFANAVGTCGAPERAVVLLCIPTALERARAIVREAPSFQSLNACQRVLVFAFEHVEAYLRDLPWLWSKYFGAGCGFRVIRNDPAFLAASLLDERDRNALLSADAPAHPTLATIVEHRGLRLRIRARSGNGRSTALFHLARQALASEVIVVLAPVMSAEDWNLLMALLTSMPSTGLWFVVDNHEVAITNGGTASVDRLLQLLALPQWQERARDVSILLAYTSEHHGIVQAHPALRTWPAIELTADEKFVRRVLQAHFAPAFKGIIDVFLAGVSRLGSLRSLINHWRRYAESDASAGPDVFAERRAIGEEWRDRYKTLSGDALRALWCIAAFTERQEETRRVSHDVLSAFFAAEEPAEPVGLATRLAVALHELDLHGWISTTDDTYALTVGASQSGLRGHPTYAVIVQSIARWAARITWAWDTALLGEILMQGIENAFFANDFTQVVKLAQRAVFQKDVVVGRELVRVLFLLWQSQCCLGEQDAFLDDVLLMQRTRTDSETVKEIVSRFWTPLTTAEAMGLRDEWYCSTDEKLSKLVFAIAALSDISSDTAQLDATLTRRARAERETSEPRGAGR
jgi:hypothetical protein